MTTAKSVVETLRQFLTLAKERDSTVISTLGFERFVHDLEDAVSKNENPLEVITKAKHEFELEYYRATAAGALEVFRSVITAATLGVKSLILMNGGGAVALLAFIGHLASTGGSANNVHKFAVPLACFVGGVFGAGLLALLFYLAQASFNVKRAGWGKFWTVAAISCCIASLSAFGVASWLSYCVFAHF